MATTLKDLRETKDVQAATNPFRSEEAPALRAVANTDQARAIAEVRAALQVAQMSPRNPVTAMDRILNACTRPALAESAVYQYSRGGGALRIPRGYIAGRLLLALLLGVVVGTVLGRPGRTRPMPRSASS